MSQIAAAIEDDNENAQPLNEVEEAGGKKENAKDLHVFAITTGTIVFQALMTCAAVYYAMVLTNWGNPVYFSSNYYDFWNNKTNNTSYWC